MQNTPLEIEKEVLRLGNERLALIELNKETRNHRFIFVIEDKQYEIFFTNYDHRHGIDFQLDSINRI